MKQWAAVLALLTLYGETAAAQVRQLAREQWTVSVLQNAWTGRPEGAAVSEAVTRDPLSGERAAGFLICAQGRPYFGVRWPVALAAPDRPVAFTLAIGQSEPITVLFQSADGSIIGRGQRESNYVAPDEGLLAQLLRGRELNISPVTHPHSSAKISLSGLSAASFDMATICSGRNP